MKTVRTDVLIVGSGFGAAAPALRLAQAGFQVTMIEKGPHIDAPSDFRQTQDPKYLLKYLTGLSGDNISFTYAEAYGGGSGFYEMVSLRAPSLVFEQTDDAGRRLWPVGLDRAALDPFYDRAEEMLHVEQIRHSEIPKSGLVFAKLMKNLGYSCDRARYAVKGCLGSGFCVTGCIYGAKQSLHFNYLRLAKEAGVRIHSGIEALSIRTLCRVRSTPEAGSLADIPYRYRVVCRSGSDGAPRGYDARLLILAGGTVGTARLLLGSRKDLVFMSHHVGRNIAFNGGVKVAGLLPPGFPDGDMFTGRSHPGMISYHFLESHGVTVSAAKPLPLQAVAAARLRLDGDPRQPDYWGEANVDLMKRYRRRVIVLYALGLTPPAAALELVRGEARAKLELDPGLRDYYRRTKKLLSSILTRNGCTLIHPDFVDGQGLPREDIHFSTAHHVGSCRMADSRDDGVVDVHGQVFDYPGLYISGGAAVPSSLAVNTSLTILANAERIADGLVRRYADRRVVVQGDGRARPVTEPGS